MTRPISTDEAAQTAVAAPDPEAVPQGPVAIEATGIEKTFRIPTHRIDSFKERAVHPFSRAEYRELEALKGISFDVHKGEFFGIVGRNGSGKSTLLKVLASIYRADAGTIRMAGRLAPFIELGVGFDPDLTARENVVLNGVMMGLSRAEAEGRLEAVLEFAELEEFVDLKLKNYSSGMMVRLAFSVMVQADADVLLIDEVLAVGDASFQQKCTDVFHEMRDAGKTIVLVTHSMAAVQDFCHRAMLLHDGHIEYIGDPEETARRYFRLNFQEVKGESLGQQVTAVPEINVRPVEAWLEDADGERITNVEVGDPLRMHVVLEAAAELVKPGFVFQCLNADGVHVFGFNRSLTVEPGQPEVLARDARVHISGTIQNQLAPGKYTFTVWVRRDRSPSDIGLQVLKPLTFHVYGTPEAPGLVSVPAQIEAVPEEGER